MNISVRSLSLGVIYVLFLLVSVAFIREHPDLASISAVQLTLMLMFVIATWLLFDTILADLRKRDEVQWEIDEYSEFFGLGEVLVDSIEGHDPEYQRYNEWHGEKRPYSQYMRDVHERW